MDFKPRHRSIFKAYTEWFRWVRRTSTCAGSAYTRMKLRQPGLMRLMLPPVGEGADPLEEYKKLERHFTGFLHRRVPGTWRTARGRKKKIRALWRLVYQSY